MAGNARYSALFDACVLFPIATADCLMSLATADLFAAKWTNEIEREWIESLEKRQPHLKGKLQYRRDQMRSAVPDWEIPDQAWRPLVGGLAGLPDPDDAHVLAAAIAGHVDCIVTTNLRHFPTVVVAPFGIEAVHPDEFIVNQWDLDQVKVIAAFRAMRSRWKRPDATPEDFAHAMERNGLAATGQRLREVSHLL